MGRPPSLASPAARRRAWAGQSSMGSTSPNRRLSLRRGGRPCSSRTRRLLQRGQGPLAAPGHVSRGQSTQLIDRHSGGLRSGEVLSPTHPKAQASAKPGSSRSQTSGGGDHSSNAFFSEPGDKTKGGGDDSYNTFFSGDETKGGGDDSFNTFFSETGDKSKTWASR